MQYVLEHAMVASSASVSFICLYCLPGRLRCRVLAFVSLIGLAGAMLALTLLTWPEVRYLRPLCE
jgi:hypothetical protein